MKVSLMSRLNKIDQFIAESKINNPHKMDAETIVRLKELIMEKGAPILDKMQAQHKKELLNALDHQLNGDNVDYSLNKALHLFMHYVMERDKGKPIYLGPEFYEAYKNGAVNVHQCEDCGCGIPVHGGSASVINGELVSIPARILTKECPLCGGKTGYTAYFYKHGGDKDAKK